MNNSTLILDAGNSSADDGFETAANMIASVEKYAVPIICFLGVSGNTLAFLVFAEKSMRSKSCSLFLAARSLSDNGFLITIFVMWLSSVLDLKLSQIAGICQVIVFLTYVFGCLSVWLVVFVTIENYIRICKPFMVNSLCKSSTARCAVILLLLIVLSCYNFPLWTMDEECTPNDESYNLLKIMVYVDSLLTFLAPTVIMLYLLYRILLSSLSSYERRRRLSSGSTQSSSNPTTKVTTMLLAVTLIFIVLNLPFHIIKLRILVMSFIEDIMYISTPFDVIIQSVAQLIYYLSMTINFFVYYTFGGSFHSSFKKLLCGKKSYTGPNGSCCVSSSFSSQKRRQSTRRTLNEFNNYSSITDIQDADLNRRNDTVTHM